MSEMIERTPFKGKSMAALVYSFSPYMQRMAKLAREVEEYEILITEHRGKDHLESIKQYAESTIYSYYDLIEREANEIRREILLIEKLKY